MGLTEQQKCLLKRQLAHTITEGSFEKLIMEQDGDGYRCEVEGDLFAIIGALAEFLNDISGETHIPLHVLATYLMLSTEIVEETKCLIEQENSQEQGFAQFMDILTGMNKEGN